MIIDLSHEITAGMATYPGIAAPELRIVVSRQQSAARLGSGASFEIDSLTLVGNTGTYLDSPFHFHPDQADLAQVPLDRLVNVPIVARLTALPPPVRAMASFPVRAVAVSDE